MSKLTPERRDVVTLLKMAAEHVLAGDAPSAGRGVASISGMTIAIAAKTMVELADAFTVAEQTIVRLTTERDDSRTNGRLVAEALRSQRDDAKTEIARLTVERDNFRQEIDALRDDLDKALAERDGLQRVVDSQDWEKAAAENDALKADLAAAQAALERIDSWLLTRPAGIHWASDSRHDEIVVLLSRLGTGEALAAVRMAQEVLQQYEREVGAVLPDGSKSGVALALTLLKAMFGEEQR